MGAKILLIEKVGVTSSIILYLFFSKRKLPLITAYHLLSLSTEFAHLRSPQVSEIMKSRRDQEMKRKAKVVVEVTFSDLRLMRESLLALRNRLIAEGRHTAPVDEMLERLFA